MGQYDINLRDYWRVIRKRKLIIIFTTIVLSFFSFVFAKMNEPAPIYSTSSAVRIEQNTALSGLVSDAAAIGQFQEITTQTAVIRSYPVLERVAKELGLVDKALTSEEISKNNRLVSIVNGLASQVQTDQVGDTNIISITVTSGDPDQAARMANAIAAVFREFDYRSRNQTVLKQHGFIKSQLELSEKRLRESEQRIKRFKEEHQFLSLNVEAQSLASQVQRLTEAVNQLREKLGRIDTAIEQIEAVEAVRAGRSERIPVDDIDPSLAALNTQLTQLQVERDNLLQNYTEEHPAVQDVLQQIKNVVAQMTSVLRSRKELVQEELKQREGDLKKLDNRYKAVPDVSLQLARLQRQLATNMEVHNLLRQKFEEVNIKLAGTQHLVTIVKPAFRPFRRDNPPHLALNSFVGALLGLVVGLVFALVIETMDTSIGAIEDVESFLEVPVLGVIPVLDTEELARQYEESNPDRTGRFTPDIYGRLVTHFVPRSPVAEAYRSFRTQMEFVSIEKGGNTFVITSSTPGEGKTTTSINFAVTCAQSNKRTLLIDADMRKPVIYRIFGIDREPGLTDILLGNNTWDECIRTMTDIMLGKFDMEDIMLTPGLDNLNLLTCGNIPPNPSELLNSGRMTQFIQEISREFDVIVMDTPPLLPVTDAAVLGTKVDGCVLVYRVGQIARGALKRAKMQLDNVHANVWGVVLNSMRAETSPDLDSFRYQSSYYYGGYAEQMSEEHSIDLPFYRRWYKKAKSLLFSDDDEQIRQEASPFARILGALLLGLSIALTAAGLAWQTGWELPIIGSIRDKYARIGQAPPDSIEPLGPIWDSVQQSLSQSQSVPTEHSQPIKQPSSDAPAPQAQPGPDQKPEAPPAKEAPASANPKPKEGASLFLIPKDSPWYRLRSAEQLIEPSATLVVKRRAALQLASLLPDNHMGRDALLPAPTHPFGITLSVNRKHASTLRHLALLEKSGLRAEYAPVRYPKGVMERVYLGFFATREEAENFLRERIAPLVKPNDHPFIDRLPYTLEVAKGLADGEADVLRVVVKAAGLQPHMERTEEWGLRLLVGAFRNPSEAEAAAALLQREKIPFQLVTR